MRWKLVPTELTDAMLDAGTVAGCYGAQGKGRYAAMIAAAPSAADDPDVVERIARALAKERGDDFDDIPKFKNDWVKKRGEFGGRFRDINEPFVGDYLDMARAALKAMEE